MIPIPVISHRRSPGQPVCVKRTLGFHLVTPHQSHWGWDCEKDGRDDRVLALNACFGEKGLGGLCHTFNSVSFWEFLLFPISLPQPPLDTSCHFKRTADSTQVKQNNLHLEVSDKGNELSHIDSYIQFVFYKFMMYLKNRQYTENGRKPATRVTANPPPLME